MSNEGRTYLNMARISNYMLSNLVEDILDMTRLNQGSFVLQMETFALSELQTSVEELYEQQVQQKGIYLRFCMSEETSSTIVNSDKKRITQILNNLVANAVKFTSRGGITVTIEPFDEDQAEPGHGLL